MKKAAAAVISVLTAAAMCGCSAKGSKSKRADAKEKPTSWAVEQRTLDDVTPRSGETQVFVKRDEEDDDIIYLIQGVLSPDSVNDKDEALDVIASYSEVMGFNDVYSELQFSKTIEYASKVDYVFDQYCDNLKAGSVELTVDHISGNKPEILISNYMDLWDFNTKPKVSEAEAIKCAEARYKVDKGTKAELKILSGPLLAWCVPVTNDDVCEVYIDARNGDIVQKTRSYA